MGRAMHFQWGRRYQRMGIWWKTVRILWGKYGYQFPIFLNSMDIAAISNAMGNWWGNLYISHVMKYITGWKSGWRIVPILWEKYEYQIPRFSLLFYCIFPCYGKLMGKPMHSQYTEYTTAWESNGKKHPYYGKSIRTNFPGFVNLTFFWKLIRKSIHFPRNEKYHRMTI